MTSKEIEAFLAIVIHKNQSKAAKSLFIEQSSLSRRLKALEDELGYKLFVRNKGRNQKIGLTTEGEKFIPLALQWRNLWEETEALNQNQNHKNKKLRIISSDGPNIYVLAGAYIDFYKKYPEINLEITTRKSRDAYMDLENDKADIAFVVIPNYSLQLETIPFYKERMLFVCSKTAPYPEIISTSALDPKKYVYCIRPLEFRLWFENWFGTSQQPSVKCDLIPIIENFIAGTENWTIIPATIFENMKSERLCSKPMTNPPPDRTIYCVTHNSSRMKAYIKDFKSIAAKYIKQLHDVQLINDKL